MIVSFKHKGSERFFLKGDPSKLNPQHISKVRRILAALHAAQTVQDVQCAGLGATPAKGGPERPLVIKSERQLAHHLSFYR